jgi:hypothetical protein
MTDRFVELERRLARLEDVRAIETLKARYVRACDRKEPAAVRRCFADRAKIDFEGFPLFDDPDAFVAIFEQWGCVPHIVDMHHLQNAIVEITGENTATGHFDLYFYQIDTRSGRHTQLAVNYDDDFARIEGQWQIVRSVSRRLSMVVKQVDADGSETVVVAGRSDDDDVEAR